MSQGDWFCNATFFIPSVDVTLYYDVDIFNIDAIIIVSTDSIKTAIHLVVSLPLNAGSLSQHPNSKRGLSSVDSRLIVVTYFKPPLHNNSFCEGDDVPLQLIEKSHTSAAESDEKDKLRAKYLISIEVDGVNFQTSKLSSQEPTTSKHHSVSMTD